MAKVTSKLQVTIPKRIAERCAIAPGDNIDFVAAGDGIHIVLGGKRATTQLSQAEKLRLFRLATARQRAREKKMKAATVSDSGRGWTREELTAVASLVDTNVLVYRFDPRNPRKQRVASRLLENGIAAQSLVLSHQSIVELVAALTRPQSSLRGSALMSLPEAIIEGEELMGLFPVLYPSKQVLVTAMRGTAAYGLPWFDAHIWACAEVNGLPEILSEDFRHGRHYGSVRTVNPFASLEERNSRASVPVRGLSRAVGRHDGVAGNSHGPQVPLVVAVGDLAVDAVAFLAPAGREDAVIALAEVSRQNAARLESVERGLPAQRQRDFFLDDLAGPIMGPGLAALRDAVVYAGEHRRHDQVWIAVRAAGPVLDARVLRPR